MGGSAFDAHETRRETAQKRKVIQKTALDVSPSARA
jgi:hypothetical protein